MKLKLKKNVKNESSQLGNWTTAYYVKSKEIARLGKPRLDLARWLIRAST